MEYPQNLLDLFDDPMLEGVRIPTQRQTADDRTQRKIDELRAWVDAHGREPLATGPIQEKLLAKSLETLKNQGLWM